MNSYQKVKKRIFQNLQDKQEELAILEVSHIDEEINNMKILLSIPEATAALFSGVKINLDNDSFERMKRDLETNFDVKVQEGILIQGEKQQIRDTTWWSDEIKLKSDNYYWSRYKKHLGKTLPFDPVIKTIDIDTDIIMNNIENPNLNTFKRYGMVVGHVQSGKTANYSSLICKAADAGYKFIVVISGDKTNLRNQTQQRLNESFIGHENGKAIGCGIGKSIKSKIPISLTTVETDFNRRDADTNSQGLNFENIKVPILVVIKKNTHMLTNVINWLNSQYKNKINHAMLMIDDESDYASINTNEHNNPTAINYKLRQLLQLFNKSCYVAYTATPYANIFIDHEAIHEEIEEDLFPKDFIYSLDAPSNYFGARKIFLENPEKYLVTINDYTEDIPSNHKKDFELLHIPSSLQEAIRVFVINVAIRNIRNDGSKHNSMLIHATRFTLVHQRFALHVERFLETIAVDINAYGKLPNAISHSKNIYDIYETFMSIGYVENKPSWKKLLYSLSEIIHTIVVREVHQKTSVPLEYRKDRVTNAIVIGGTSVARGYTLEGLSVSYFLRNTVFYDTLMQMGRWFGYRINYQDLCKVYMSATMIDNFARIILSTEDLIDDFKRMSNENMTPEDFGLAVKHHPDSGLQVTARNKQKNTKDIYFDMKLDGQCKETSWLHKDKSIRKQNIKAIENLVFLLKDKKNEPNVGNRYLWKDINKELVQKFLSDFTIYSSDPFGLRSRMPIDFINKYIKDIDTKWDIALYSGESNSQYSFNEEISINKEIRQLTSNKDSESYFEILNRQVSSGSAEGIVLEEEDRKRLKSKRKDIRAIMSKPLLMLHILETPEDDMLAAFGISFPGGIKSDNKTIRLKINSVYIQDILAREASDD